MKQSMMFIPTLREYPKDAEVISHKIMMRGGFIKQTAAGVYTYLPLAYKVIKKIENIVREELNKIDGSELLMPALQTADLWKESNRWDNYGPELMRLKDRNQRDFCLGPTHEEVITFVVREYINSYKKLPLNLYQIQTKFRDEMRPRFGLMRGREFIMKDAYTFHATEEDLDQWYNIYKEAYFRIFERCGLATKYVEADTGQMGGKESAEFMVMSEVGEDTIVYSDTSDFAANYEVCSLAEGEASPDGIGKIKHAKGIEVGNIFKLGTRYSETMNVYFIDENQKKLPVIMGCYGIGISRVLMAVIEQYAQDDKVHWPEELSPFDVHIIPVDVKREEQLSAANDLYNQLKNNGYDCLIDDRAERAGVKFNDADLIGAPLRIVVGRGIKDGIVEIKNHKTGETTEVSVSEVLNNINNIYKK